MTGYIYLDPVEGKHEFTFIFLHGLGDSADGFLDLFNRHEPEGLVSRNCRIVLPTA